jgi:hypothetical protein
MGDIWFVTVLKKIYGDIGASSLVTGMFVVFASCSFVVKGPWKEEPGNALEYKYLGP